MQAYPRQSVLTADRPPEYILGALHLQEDDTQAPGSVHVKLIDDPWCCSDNRGDLRAIRYSRLSRLCNV